MPHITVYINGKVVYIFKQRISSISVGILPSPWGGILMFQNLLMNAAMLVAILSICNQLFKNTGLNRTSPIRYKLV
jgi:hypothetical protein